MKTQIFILCTLLCAVGCKRHETHIEGNISGITNKMIYLLSYDTPQTGVDSMLTVGGKFSFIVPQMPVDMMFIHVSGEPNFHIPVFVDGHPVTVTGDFTHPGEIKVSGSDANNALQDYRNSLSRLDVMSSSIALDINAIDPSGADSMKYRALEIKRDSVQRLREAMRVEYVHKNPDSPVAAFLVYATMPEDVTAKQVDSILSQLDTIKAKNAFIDRLRAKRKALSIK